MRQQDEPGGLDDVLGTSRVKPERSNDSPQERRELGDQLVEILAATVKRAIREPKHALLALISSTSAGRWIGRSGLARDGHGCLPLCKRASGEVDLDHRGLRLARGETAGSCAAIIHLEEPRPCPDTSCHRGYGSPVHQIPLAAPRRFAP